jgi:hypothetical protein
MRFNYLLTDARAHRGRPTVLDGQEEARVLDLRLAEALGFDRPRNIRKLIERNKLELSTYGDICSTMEPLNPGKRGPRATEYWLNEGQAFVLCMFDRDGGYLNADAMHAGRRQLAGCHETIDRQGVGRRRIRRDIVRERPDP